MSKREGLTSNNLSVKFEPLREQVTNVLEQAAYERNGGVSGQR
ncbi:hypothetical protein [Halocatena pleomorpha]|nr:hypothetical protein [Halocatena pleomorpha]